MFSCNTTDRYLNLISENIFLFPVTQESIKLASTLATTVISLCLAGIITITE